MLILGIQMSFSNKIPKNFRQRQRAYDLFEFILMIYVMIDEFFFLLLTSYNYLNGELTGMTMVFFNSVELSEFIYIDRIQLGCYGSNGFVFNL